MDFQSPTGVFDILPSVPKDPWREIHLWEYVERTCRELARVYGFSEIRTPIFERASLFQRSVGEDSDIVMKEMYVFKDLGGRELALRPEGTATIMRALLEAGNFTPTHSQRYFYIGPMFRYERPQAGRFRQHHQFGTEVIGIAAPEQDAEMIAMLMQLFKRLGLPHLKVYINSLGVKDSRAKFRDALFEYLSAHRKSLSEDSLERLERNPLRILDSKDPGDREIVAQAPSILEFLRSEDSDHFHRVQDMLSYLHIPYEVSPLLVRGLDYYQRTVFEVTSGKLGAQNTVGAGGRYDGLLKELGGPDLASIGWAAGLERIIQLFLKEGRSDDATPDYLELIIIPLDEKSKVKAVQTVEALRELGVRSLVDFSGKKLKNALTMAVQSQVKHVLILGENERETGRAKIKRLEDGVQTEISLTEIDLVAKLLKGKEE